MITSNCLKEYGKYHSFLKEYLMEVHHYHNETLLYSDKYGIPAFTITRPTKEYRNCRFVNGYPHFEIPKEICIREIQNFLEDVPIYTENYTIRYGDMHPNKPVPMLGQMRNILLNDIYSKMIKTSGKMNSIFTIGDISEKTIKYFVEQGRYNPKEDVFNQIFTGILNSKDLDNAYVLAYQKFCEDRKRQTEDFLKQMHLDHKHLLLESSLYQNQALYKYIKNLKTEEGLKENNEAKYLLQEFMFLLNDTYKEDNIINIIGLDQSDHVKKVYDVIKENQLCCKVSFLNYNLCKQAGSRDIEEWKKLIDGIVEKTNIRLGGKLIPYYDFIKFAIATNNCNAILDFNKAKIMNYEQIKEIYTSLEKSGKKRIQTKSLQDNPLLSQMTLVNQVFDSAVVSGEPARIIKYLYTLAKEYNKEETEYDAMSNLYFNFTKKCLDSISLSNTETFQKVLKGRG